MVNIKEENGNFVFLFSGKLDTTTCLQLEKEVLAHVRAAKGDVIFDLGEVNFVASIFLRLCIQSCKDVGTPRFRIANVSPAVHKVFKLSGLDTLIAIE